MEEKILEIVKVSRNNGLTKQEVYKKLAYTNLSFEDFEEIFDDLLNQNKIYNTGKDKYTLNPFEKGEVLITKKGVILVKTKDDTIEISKDEFTILSSSALVLREILPDAGDLDIAVSKKGLGELKKNYNVTQNENGWYIVTDKIECVLDDMTGKKENLEGYNLQDIYNYLSYLKSSSREKDKKRIPIVEKYIKSR